MNQPAFQNPIPRIYYLDYLRGFMVLLVVLDHAMHGYTRYFADFWFIQDIERSVLLDFFHVHNDVIMMPFMFFLAGLFVFPSLERRGIINYISERFLRLGIPLLMGVLLIVPLITHDKILAHGEKQSFFDHWQSTILTFNQYPLDKATAAGFWFLTYLILLTVGIIVLYKLYPSTRTVLARYAAWIVKQPFWGVLSLVMIASSLTLISDWIWGGPYWFVYRPFFGVRKARFLVKIFFFVMGVAMADTGFLKDPKSLKASWPVWALLGLGIFGLYSLFVLTYIHDGLFNMPIANYVYAFKTYPSFDMALRLIEDEGLMASIRAALLGTVMVMLAIFYLAFFSRFLNKPYPVWQSLAACSYGIYIFHEPLVTLVNRYFLDDPLPAEFKFLMAASFSLGCTWLGVHFLLKIPFMKRIIG